MELSEDGKLEAYNLSLAFVPCMLAKAVCELGIPDILAAHNEAMSALQLTHLLTPPPTRPMHEAAEQLDRMMRCLCAYKIFRSDAQTTTAPDHSPKYSLTPTSRWLQRGAFKDFILFHMSSPLQNTWHCLSQSLLHGGAPFAAAHSKDLWAYAAADPAFSRIFNSGMASVSRFTFSAFVQHYEGLQDGVVSLVDVGGGTGVGASYIAARYPSIKVINFDLPAVISTAPTYPGVEHVGGDMFQSIPTGDALFMKNVLHDWGDEDCIKILHNCHKVLSRHGKLIIMEIVLSTEDSPFQSARYALDMIMQAYTNGGKERTRRQWEELLNGAKFSISRIVDLPWTYSIMEAIPVVEKQ